MRKKFNLITIAAILISLTASSCKKDYTLIVGGFTKKDGDKGLSVFSFNSNTGKLKLLSESDVGPNPSYFCFSKKNNMFYVLNEVMEFKGEFGGGLTTLKFNDKTNEFKKLNELRIPYGGPCFISMSADSGYLYTANYPNGSVAVVRLDDNGIPEAVTDTILYNKAVPDASHAHMILHDPAGKHVYVSDLGLDRVVAYNFDPLYGKLIQLDSGIASVPLKSGPRHFVFNPDGSKLYLINELGSILIVFNITDQGLKAVQTLPTVRKGFTGNNYCADIHIGKDGKYLYGSNRGENSIVTFMIGSDGLLTLAGHTSCGGDWPRNFTIDPSGKNLLVGNQKSDSIAVFRISRKTGLPEEPPKKFPVKAPECLKFY
ncbi:MAG: lactonase family protein [Bacteroidota bacterium]|nr:lactonase family protein [Bacteroidota bacterium]